MTEPMVFQCPDCQRQWARAPLTPTQLAVLRFCWRYHRERGLTPSQKEIAAHMGWRSAATVSEIVHHLELKGYVRQVYNKARGLLLIAPEPE